MTSVSSTLIFQTKILLHLNFDFKINKKAHKKELKKNYSSITYRTHVNVKIIIIVETNSYPENCSLFRLPSVVFSLMNPNNMWINWLYHNRIFLGNYEQMMGCYISVCLYILLYNYFIFLSIYRNFFFFHNLKKFSFIYTTWIRQLLHLPPPPTIIYMSRYCRFRHVLVQ